MAAPVGYEESQWNGMSTEERNTILANTWKNFTISSTYEPGSIFKPCVAAAAIEEGVIKNTDSFYCGGKKVVADRSIACHLRSGHGALSVEGVIAQSCNVGMMDIAAKMGVPLFYKYQKNYGVGENTGIDLPNEISAVLLCTVRTR